MSMTIPRCAVLVFFFSASLNSTTQGPAVRPSVPVRFSMASSSPTPKVLSRANYGAVPTSARVFVGSHIGLFMLLGAQFLASVQGLITRFLAISLPDGRRYHAFEVLFARMSITLVGCVVWMWWNSVEHAPFGRRDVRWLLVARGMGGLVGVYGLYSE